MLFFILLFSISSIICQQNYQTIPLRYDAAINHLAQYQHHKLVDLLEDTAAYSITPDEMSTYISLLASNETTECERDFELILLSVLKRESWALKVIDAWGKPIPSGILKGNVYWVGNYDECLQPMYFPANKSFVSQPFDTQYCTLYPSAASQQTFGSSGVVFGLCIPSSCNRQSVVSLVHTLFNSSNITENNLVCSNDPPNGQEGLTAGAIVTITILSLLGLLVLTGTIVDIILMLRHDPVDKMTSHINGYHYGTDTGVTGFEPITLVSQHSRFSLHALIDTAPRTVFLAEFSALRSLSRTFTMKKKDNDNSFLFINGLRVLSLFWVIIGHTFLFGLMFSSNPLDVIVWTRNIFLQLISNATFSVDTFFVLSGFLTAILFVRQVEKEGKLSFRLMILYYVHRYIRLTPAFLLVVSISINLTPYFGNGPVYPTQQGFEVSQCRTQYWWTSILYVGNLVKPDYMCLGIAWYLHNDMQFYWIAPLCLIPFVIGRKPIAFLMTILLILVGIGSTVGLLIYYPSLQTGLFGTLAPAAGPSFFNTIYITPWCRVSAYFIGVLAGFLVINTGRSYRLNKHIIRICSITAVIFALACIFAIYPDSILVPGIDRTSFIIYQSLSRTLWSMAIGWLLFLCITNRGGIVNKILSWPVWAPLARLNYSTYLIHYTVILITVTNQRIPYYFQPHLLVNSFVSQIFFSYVAGIVVLIFLETPFFILEKKIFKR